MRFYQELTLIKTPEITPYFIWSKLYTQLHLALVEQQNPDKKVNFGVSFPEYLYREKDKEGSKEFASLGTKVRVFAPNQQELEQLNLAKWLGRLTDYVHIKSIQAVPENTASHLVVKRYRAKTLASLERKTRRFMQREATRQGKEISFKEAQALQHQRFAKQQEVSLQEAEKQYLQPTAKNLPFIKMKSYSGNKEFSLQIEQQTVEQPQQGVFNTYGLSSQATVPHW